MIRLHSGFDSLDFAIEANITKKAAEHLAWAQGAAREKREPQLATYGGRDFHVAESGASGGYRYRLDTGPFGETWFVKEPNRTDPWGVRVSIKSLPLAVYGLDRCVAAVFERLEALGANATLQQTSLGRLDYAQDFLLDGFSLDASRIVAHSRTGTSADGELATDSTGGVTRALRIGKMPGKQVGIYDKRRDVLDKQKEGWWDIWNAALDKQGLPRIAKETTKGRLWRFEVRAGKKFLKAKRVVTLADLLSGRGVAALEEVAAKIRYTEPSEGDGNRARWPDTAEWQAVRGGLAKAAACAGPRDDRSNAPLNTPLRISLNAPLTVPPGTLSTAPLRTAGTPAVSTVTGTPYAPLSDALAHPVDNYAETADNTAADELATKVRETMRRQAKQQLMQQIVGCGASYAHLGGHSAEAATRAVAYAAQEITKAMAREPDQFAQKMWRASERYGFQPEPSSRTEDRYLSSKL